MKKALLALFAIATVTAASAFAADKTDVPAPVVDNGVRPPMERDRGPLPPFPPQLLPHRPVLFSATVATDTPAETINKLTALIPAGQAKHYEREITHRRIAPGIVFHAALRALGKRCAAGLRQRGAQLIAGFVK